MVTKFKPNGLTHQEHVVQPSRRVIGCRITAEKHSPNQRIIVFVSLGGPFNRHDHERLRNVLLGMDKANMFHVISIWLRSSKLMVAKVATIPEERHERMLMQSLQKRGANVGYRVEEI